MFNKEIIKDNFSKCAKYYDRHSAIQNLCALRLIKGIKERDVSNILDIGCGTGNYTKLLNKKFSAAQIRGVDISPGMIAVAKKKMPCDKIDFIVADAEEIDFKEKFDIISSNVSFQWFTDLETALFRYSKLLNKHGYVLFSTFGPLTFFELNESLREFFGQSASISACSFLEKRDIEKTLKKIFSKVEVKQEIYKEKVCSLKELIKKIKHTGARGNGVSKKNFWTNKKISDIERIYRKKFKDVTATYQVFFCKGIK